MFRHVIRRLRAGLANRGSCAPGPGPSLHPVRFKASAFLTFELAVTRVYAVTGRSSVWTAILKRSINSARSICRKSSMSICGALLLGASLYAFATTENLSELNHFGAPTSPSLFPEWIFQALKIGNFNEVERKSISRFVIIPPSITPGAAGLMTATSNAVGAGGVGRASCRERAEVAV